MPTHYDRKSDIEEEAGKFRYKVVGTVDIDKLEYEGYLFTFNPVLKFYCVLRVERRKGRYKPPIPYLRFEKERVVLAEYEWKDDWNGSYMPGHTVNSFDLDYHEPYDEMNCPGHDIKSQIASQLMFILRHYQLSDPHRDYYVSRLVRIQWKPEELFNFQGRQEYVDLELIQ